MRSLCALLLTASLMICGAGCGGGQVSGHRKIVSRNSTAGDALLSSAPLGADLLLEVDLKRLRNNAVVGTLLASLAPPASVEAVDLVQFADTALLCVYGIGETPRQLVLLQSTRAQLPGAVALGDGLFAVGDSGLLRRAAGLQSIAQSMAADLDLLQGRAEVMPAKANSAALRVAIRLDFDARVSVASSLALSDVPVSLSLWGDVVDDLAMVAHFQTDDVEDLPRLQRAISGLQGRFLKRPLFTELGLQTALRDARVTRSADSVQVVFVLGPQRLQLVVRRILQYLAKQNT